MDIQPDRPVTKSQLKAYFSKLGITPGQTVMLHISVKSIGWLVGGPEIIIRALLELLDQEGTLMMYIGWEDSPYTMEGWSPEMKSAYLRECTPYDPETARAVVDWSILAELFRKWPGARRSMHPDGSFAAVGKHAAFLTKDHSLKYGYGIHSPLAKLIALQGYVALIGAPLTTVTLLHHAEDRAAIPAKKIVRYSMPMLGSNGLTEWVGIEEFDTSEGVVDGYKGDYFLDLMNQYLLENQITPHKVGNATSYLFNATRLNSYAVHWMEQHLNKRQG
ncbi:aminoglycoside 3-N-acetyltransferase [Rhodocytophaga aerolata]|uniref:Aminoglycoside N(3)-acetyltransferase n=1 Tax=Rhodocytophaga aerolata TaxID=455078 RepID=A0ABT8R471_9BACT|nr:aminoglycoside 3-N-acetyltransferase [Rhodocytophaga aerolata]MDO1446900.1 aminoglycoside 3-N-acetyltransferase [Rhodocytophaga aerolata]